MSYPFIASKNQFGETSNSAIVGGGGAINCSFVVDPANGNGLGIRSLKGVGVKSVYMHTSATPATGNPNPAVGYILVQLQNDYSGYQGGTYGFVSSLTGSPANISSGVTQGAAYVIITVGTTTQAQWQAIGLPANVPAAPGVSFIASVTGNGTGTGTVDTALVTGSGVSQIDVIGDPNLSSAPTDGSGAWLLLRCLTATNSSTTTLHAAAPVTGTVIGLTFVMTGDSGVLI